MAAAVSSKPHQNPIRPPLLPSDPDNAPVGRRPKSREVSSRNLSTSSSSTSSSSSSSSSASAKRCPSPFVSRTGHSMAPTPAVVKRSQSVDRRRPVTPRPNSLDLRTVNRNNNRELSAAQRLLLTTNRSLSVSFQGESFSYQVSKARPAVSPNVTRKGTPERRKVATPGRGADQIENSKAELWPARMREPNSMRRSVDCSDARKKLVGSVGNNMVGSLQNSLIDNRVLVNSRLSSDLTSSVLRKKDEITVGIVGSDGQCGHVTSDIESVSSGSASGAQECDRKCNGESKRGSCGQILEAKFWQDTNHRVGRQREPGSAVAKKSTPPTLSNASKKFGFDSPVSSPKGVVNSKGQFSPIRSAVRPSSPSKLGATLPSNPSRAVNPSKVRNGVVSGLSGYFVNMPCIPSFAANTKRGKFGEDRIVYAHMLRLLHNRMLQWRFVNAQADAALSAQRINAEKSIYNAWISTSKLQESVKVKRAELQLLSRNLKLTSILKGQMICLDAWAVLDQKFSSSLTGATEALRASTLRLPVVGQARVNVQKLNDAVCSAVDVMQAMASSICALSSKVSETNSLLAELATLSANECALLDQCRDFLSTVAALQVKECSLRTHIVQLKHWPYLLKMKV